MNVREYLESIRALDFSIEAKLHQEEMLRTRLTATEAHLGGDLPRQASPDHDKMGAVIAEIVDLQNERNAEIDRFVDMKAVIKDAVKKSSSLRAHRDRELLFQSHGCNGDRETAWILPPQRLQSPRPCNRASGGKFAHFAHPDSLTCTPKYATIYSRKL